MTPPILTPPTDNYYKFTAIAGVAIFLFFSYYLLNPEKWNLLEEEKSGLERQKEMINQRCDFFKTRYAYYGLLISTNPSAKSFLVNKRETLDSNLINSIQLYADVVDISFAQKRSRQRSDIDSITKLTFESISNNYDKKIGTIESEIKSSQRDYFFGLVWVIIGALLFIYGFTAWFKLQQKLDTILEREYQNAIASRS